MPYWLRQVLGALTRLGMTVWLITIGVGCTLILQPHRIDVGEVDTSGGYRCTATLVDSEGGELHVASDAEHFDGADLEWDATCEELADTAEDVDSSWQQYLHFVTADDPDLSDDTWCLREASCTNEYALSDPVRCAMDFALEPLRDCPPAGGCLTLTPGPDPAAPAFASWLDFGEVDVGVRGERLVRVTNALCDEAEVYFNESISGTDPESFGVGGDGCAPPPGAPPGEGHPLGRGEWCDLTLSFTPATGGPLSAETSVVDRFRDQYRIALQGSGRGGLLEVPGYLCVGPVVGPRPECLGEPGTEPADLPVAHVAGPAVEVESVEVLTGRFHVDPTSFTVSVGERAPPIQVVWCPEVPGSAASERGSLLITTNGANSGNGEITVDLEGMRAACDG